MKPEQDKKSIYYITLHKTVTTVEYYSIKHGNRAAAERLAEKGLVTPWYSAQISNHRKVVFTMEIPENKAAIEAVDGEAIRD